MNKSGMIRGWSQIGQQLGKIRPAIAAVKLPRPAEWSRGQIFWVLFLLALVAVFVRVATPRPDGTLFGSYNMRMTPIDRSQTPEAK